VPSPWKGWTTPMQNAIPAGWVIVSTDQGANTEVILDTH
jgi:uncharacterized protein YbdZ (MbtH family)